MKFSLEASFFCAWILCMSLWKAAYSAGKLIHNTALN